MDSDFLTYQQASKLSNIPINTLYGLVCKGRIPHIKIGPRFVRFEKSVLLEWLKKFRVEAK